MEIGKARLVAKSYQDPDPRMGNAEIAGRESRRSSHLHVIYLGALRKWPLWSLDVKDACLQADGFGCDAYLRAPWKWNSADPCRVWKLRKPAHGSNGAPVAFRRSSREYVVNSVSSLPTVGPRFEVSSLDPCLYFVYRNTGSAVGVLTAQMDAILGCGECDLLAKGERFGGMFWGNGSPRGVVCTRGRASGPGKGFLCDVGPGGLHEEREIITHVP